MSGITLGGANIFVKFAGGARGTTSYGYTSYGKANSTLHGHIYIRIEIFYSNGSPASDARSVLRLKTSPDNRVIAESSFSGSLYSTLIPVDTIVDTAQLTLPATLYFEVSVTSPFGSGVFRSGEFKIQPKPTQAVIKLTYNNIEKSAYNYGERIFVNAGFTYGPEYNIGVPTFVRIKRPDGSIVRDFGTWIEGGRDYGTTNEYYPIILARVIDVNTTNFPTSGTYIIEVADNPSYSPAAVIPMQVGIQDILTLVYNTIPVIVVAFLESNVLDDILKIIDRYILR